LRILFVCLGNICRSPTAEAVMRALVVDVDLQHVITVDSAGTGAWHAGDAPDARATAAAAARGIELQGRARRVTTADFADFDVIVAMDRANRAELMRLAPDQAGRDKVRLLLDGADVPDPYYGGPRGFDDVLDLVNGGCARLLGEFRS
jgi:protein-tyrosine phosphatase